MIAMDWITGILEYDCIKTTDVFTRVLLVMIALDWITGILEYDCTKTTDMLHKFYYDDCIDWIIGSTKNDGILGLLHTCTIGTQ